ncbi:catechol O-methyltransferase A-like [Corticium candelabrum]|uniref:catechol O-methyltransferase A-like n=1 Tax=Corticium candelabrum TaxID=121492 RepID=UPI002E259A9D|nr:catechol O-methyltransferase A-like [Corticium candelabrum]
MLTFISTLVYVCVMYSVLWDFFTTKALFVIFLVITLLFLLLQKRNYVFLAVKVLPFLVYDKLRGTSAEQQCLEYVLANARKGDAESVLNTVDHFTCNCRLMMNIGPEKRLDVLDQVVKSLKPKSVLELGTYCGYSAIAVARHLDPGSRLYSVEINATHADIARKIVAFSGLSDRIEVVEAASDDIVANVKSKLGITDGFDLVLLDHWQSYYIRDLKTLIEHNRLHHGSVVIADNMLFPKVSEYANYIRNNTDFESKLYEVTTLHMCNGISDGMEVSTYLPKNS